MFKIVLVVVAMIVCLTVDAQTHARKVAPQSASSASDGQSMPSEAEINELVNKTSEYIDTYRRTFTNAKPSLAKAANPGFYEKAMTLCGQADDVVAAIKKNGSTGVSLVSLIAILDDMSLNGARASAQTMLVAAKEDPATRTNHAMQDFQDIAQAEKNCYDISELLFHATIRYISVEETALRALLAKEGK